MTAWAAVNPGQTSGSWTQLSTGNAGEYLGYFNGNLAPASGRQCYHLHTNCAATCTFI